MGHVSDEARALHVEHQPRWLASCRECNLNLTVVHLVDISICRNSKQVSLRVLGGAVKGYRNLEDFFEISWSLADHFIENLNFKLYYY